MSGHDNVWQKVGEISIIVCTSFFFVFFAEHMIIIINHNIWHRGLTDSRCDALVYVEFNLTVMVLTPRCLSSSQLVGWARGSTRRDISFLDS
jgi:hypothetical protein